MHLSPIEYIGSKPRKPKRRAHLKRFFMVLFLVSISLVGFFRIGATKLIAAQGNDIKKLSAQEFVEKYVGAETIQEQFLKAALERTEEAVT